MKLAGISLQASITGKTKAQQGYIATNSSNFPELAKEVADEFDVTPIAGNTENTTVNTEGYTVGYYLDTEGNEEQEGNGYITIWYTLNSLRSTLDREEAISKYGITDIQKSSDSRNQATLVAVIQVENYSCILSNTGLTSTIDGNVDITKDAFSKTTLNGGLSFTSTGTGVIIENQNNENIVISKENLYAYYNSKNYIDTSESWDNEVGNYANINIVGNATINEDGGINLNRKSNNTYATIDLSEKSTDSLTIYIIAKSIEANSDNARIIEIPKNPTGSQGSTTPYICVKNSTNRTIGYGTFLSDKTTTLGSLDYNVMAMRLEQSDNTPNGKGTYTFFTNGTKYDAMTYQGRGNTIYLSQCTYHYSGYGNNAYKMLAIYDTAHSDEEIISNIRKLKKEYQIIYSPTIISSNIQFGNSSLAFDGDKTTTNPYSAITFQANQKDSYIGCTLSDEISPYKYDLTIMGYGTAKDYSIILQGLNSEGTWENIGDEHILTTKGNGNASYGENIDYSFEVATSKIYTGLRIINNYSNSGNGEETWHKYGNYAMRITEVKFYYNLN